MADADQRYRLDPARTSFLDLPPELRNQIYELALLSPCLPVVSRPSKLQLWGDYSSKRRAQPHLRSVMLKRPVRERSAWLSNTVTCRHNASLQAAADIELGVDTVANVKVTPTQSSYELHKCANVSSSLLMANRQIYSETANIFYGRNVFAFNTRWEDACFAPLSFFNDLGAAFAMIRSLHLRLNLPPPWKYTDSASVGRAPPSSYHWKNLMGVVKQLSLRHLGLSVHGNLCERTNWSLDTLKSVQWTRELLRLPRVDSVFLAIHCASIMYAWQSVVPVIASTVEFIEALKTALLRDPANYNGSTKVYKIKSKTKPAERPHLTVIFGKIPQETAGCEGVDIIDDRLVYVAEEEGNNVAVDITNWRSTPGLVNSQSFWEN